MLPIYLLLLGVVEQLYTKNRASPDFSPGPSGRTQSLTWLQMGIFSIPLLHGSRNAGTTVYARPSTAESVQVLVGHVIKLRGGTRPSRIVAGLTSF